jgi:hypothetical protein
MDQTLGSSSDDVLDPPVRGGRSLTTDERRSLDLSSTIDGWGSDLDAARRPGVPRDKAPDIGIERLYPPIEQQLAKVKILKSTEHPALTPVFGTSCPPSGVSGLIREFSYRYSEGRMARWLGLMLADRVNVVEAVVSDLAHLHIPDVVKETGIATEFRYNKRGLVKKAAVAGIGLLAYMAYARARKKS